MKIVHTADWHVGKSLKGKHRSSEHREVLQELKEFLQQKKIDLLIVAGDVFDSNTPSAEAEEIVYKFFHEVIQLGVQLVVIAGNHDSGLRFEAISNLVKLAGATIKGMYLPDTSHDFVWTNKNGEKIHILAIPFIPENIFVRAEDLTKESSPTGIYSHKFGDILRKVSPQFMPNSLHFVVSHVLMHGARPGGSERKLYLGDNYALHSSEIPNNIDYIALGHVHLHQKIAGPCPIFYPGSPLQMDFGESNTPKGFLYFEAFPNIPVEPQFIEFQHGKKLLSIQGEWEEILALAESNPSLKNAHLKITISTETNTMGLSYQVKKIFPNAIDIRREYSQKEQTVLPASDWLPKLYQEYFKKEYQAEATLEVIKEFENLYQKKKK